MSNWEVLIGDCRDAMRLCIERKSVQTCVTSPPYFGLRDYGHEGQIGLEPTPDEFVAAMVDVFREVREVLADDGTVWLNLGDSYAGSWGARGRGGNTNASRPDLESKHGTAAPNRFGFPGLGVKPKDLIGIPWRVAFALQADGWYLRQDIIWAKPNPMPESVTDRCTKAHEYVFLLSKNPKYYFDAKAIAEPVTASTVARLAQPNLENQKGSDRVPGKTNGTMKAKPPRFGGGKYGDDDTELSRTKSGNEYTSTGDGLRNKRTVWTVATSPFKEAHFATYPPALIEPCILAGSRPGDLVLDPFGGSGTTAGVALRRGRRAVLCELNPDYAALMPQRISKIVGRP